MNAADTAVALRLRRELTGESFNDGTVAAWNAALADWQLADVRVALVDASREHRRVTVPHVVACLPRIPGSPGPPPPEWTGPTDRGRRLLELIREHLRDHHGGEQLAGCPSCHPTPPRRPEQIGLL